MGTAHVAPSPSTVGPRRAPRWSLLVALALFLGGFVAAFAAFSESWNEGVKAWGVEREAKFESGSQAGTSSVDFALPDGRVEQFTGTDAEVERWIQERTREAAARYGPQWIGRPWKVRLYSAAAVVGIVAAVVAFVTGRRRRSALAADQRGEVSRA